MPLDAIASSPANDDVIRLIMARNLIETPHTWIKRAYADNLNGTTRYCLVGALSRACGSVYFHIPNRRERRLINLLAKELGHHYWTVCTSRHRLKMYNDAPYVWHHDVIALIDRTIARLLHVPTYELETQMTHSRVEEWVA